MIIGLSGKIGSGKDLVGSIIQYLTTNIKHSYRYKDFYDFNVSNLTSKDIRIHNTFEIKKFADSLKDIVCILVGCTREQLEDREFKEKELGEEWWKWYWHYYKITNPVSSYFNTQKEAEVFYDNSTDNIVNKSTLQVDKLTPRKLLQLLGTECGRDIIHPNIWVNSLMSEYRPLDNHNNITNKDVIDYSQSTFPNWIITDMRFKNELKAIEDRGGISIRVNRNFHFDMPNGVHVETMRAGSLTELGEHPSETALDNATFKYTINNNESIEELIEKVRDILIKESIT